MPFLLAGPVAKVAAIVLALAAIFGLGYYKGYQAEKQAWDATLAREAQAAAKQVIAGSEITAKVVTKYVKVKGATETIIKEIEKEVPVYVASDCFIPTGFVGLWNAGNNLRTPAITPGRPDDSPSGLTLTDLARAHLAEAATYHAETDKLRALQEWVRTQYELAKGPP